MKTLTEQLNELSKGEYWIPSELKEEIIKIVKERDTFIIGEIQRVALPKGRESIDEWIEKDNDEAVRNQLKKEQKERAEESL